MDLLKLQAAKDAACKAALSVGDKLRAGFGQIGHVTKSDDSVVTELDKWAEEQLKEALKAFDSNIGFLGEEHGAEGSTELRWLIDPIDGTEHFIRGIPSCVTMMALVEDNEVKVAVLYNFVTHDLYWAIRGKGAWSGEKRLLVSDRVASRAFIDVGIDYENEKDRLFAAKLRKNTGAIFTRFYGSGHTGMLIASGRIEGRITTLGKGGPWDYAPISLLISEAGGKVSLIDGTPYHYLDYSSFVGASPKIHELIIKSAR